MINYYSSRLTDFPASFAFSASVEKASKIFKLTSLKIA